MAIDGKIQINPFDHLQSKKDESFSENTNDNLEIDIFKHIQKRFHLNDPQIKNKRLRTFVDKFYQSKIIHEGYKKCTCHACLRMAFPMLIKFDADPSNFQAEHEFTYNYKISRSQNKFCKYIFTKLKSLEQFNMENQVRQYHSQKHSSTNCQQQNLRLFDHLVKVTNNVPQQEQSRDDDTEQPQKLPKLTQVLIKNSQTGQNETLGGPQIDYYINEVKEQRQAPILEDQLDERIGKIMIDQNNKSRMKSKIGNQINQEAFIGYDFNQFEIEKMEIQHEFDQLKQIQKLLNQLKIQKIDKYRKKKYKYLLARNMRKTQLSTMNQSQILRNGQLFENVLVDVFGKNRYTVKNNQASKIIPKFEEYDQKLKELNSITNIFQKDQDQNANENQMVSSNQELGNCQQIKQQQSHSMQPHSNRQILPDIRVETLQREQFEEQFNNLDAQNGSPDMHIQQFGNQEQQDPPNEDQIQPHLYDANQNQIKISEYQQQQEDILSAVDVQQYQDYLNHYQKEEMQSQAVTQQDAFNSQNELYNNLNQIQESQQQNMTNVNNQGDVRLPEEQYMTEEQVMAQVTQAAQQESVKQANDLDQYILQQQFQQYHQQQQEPKASGQGSAAGPSGGGQHVASGGSGEGGEISYIQITEEDFANLYAAAQSGQLTGLTNDVLQQANDQLQNNQIQRQLVQEIQEQDDENLGSNILIYNPINGQLTNLAQYQQMVANADQDGQNYLNQQLGGLTNDQVRQLMHLQSQQDENLQYQNQLNFEPEPHAYHIVDGEHHYLAMTANDQPDENQMEENYLQIQESQSKISNQIEAFQKLFYQIQAQEQNQQNVQNNESKQIDAQVVELDDAQEVHDEVHKDGQAAGTGVVAMADQRVNQYQLEAAGNDQQELPIAQQTTQKPIQELEGVAYNLINDQQFQEQRDGHRIGLMHEQNFENCEDKSNKPTSESKLNYNNIKQNWMPSSQQMISSSIQQLQPNQNELIISQSQPMANHMNQAMDMKHQDQAHSPGQSSKK